MALAQREARKSAPTEGGVKGQKAGAGAGSTYARLQEKARGGKEKEKEKEEAENRKRLLLAASRAARKVWYRKIGWPSDDEGEAEGEAAVGGKRAAMGASDGRKAGPRKRKAGRRLVVAAAESSSSSSSSSESSSESSGDEAGKKSGKAEVKAEEAKADDNDIAVGHTVHIEGLVVSVDMNGRTVVVTGRYHDRWVVRVDGKDCNFAAKNLRLERVEVDSD